MVGTIAPIVYGEIKSARPRRIVLLHSVAYILGASLFGGGIAWVGSVLLSSVPIADGLTLFVSGLLAMFCALVEFDFIRVPLPQSQWQVPIGWRRLPFELMAVLYGMVLGTGILTRVSVSTFYVLISWALICRHPVLGAVSLGFFGVGRALTVIWLSYGFRNLTECNSLVDKLPLWRGVLHVLNGMLLGMASSCMTLASIFH